MQINYFRRFLLLLLSGFLIFLAFPGGPQPPLAWIAFAPFAVALAGLTSGRALLLGIPAGFLFWYVSTWWFVEGLRNISEMEVLAALPVSIVPALAGGIPYMLFAFLAAAFRLFGRNPRPFFAAALLTLLIVYVPNIFPGNIAHSLYRSRAAIQICDLGGVTLLLFCVNLVNFSFASAALTLPDKRRASLFLSLGALTIAGLYIYGSVRIAQWEKIMAAAPRVKTGLIQPNIPVMRGEQALFVPETDKGNDLDTAITLTRSLLKSSPDLKLLAWPEMPLSFSIVNSPDDYAKIDSLMREIKTPLLLSGYFYPNELKDGRIVFHNAVHLLRDNAEAEDTYIKNRLIPFGEYVPLENALPWISEFFPDTRRYSPGERVSLIRIDENLTAGTPVCLEAIYSDLILSMVRNGARLLVNPGDDAYFGNTSGAFVHLALTTFRAVEYRVPVARVMNSGVTQVIDHTGNFLIPGGRLFQSGAWSIEVPVSEQANVKDTNKTGRLVCLGILLLACLKSAFRKRSPEVK